MRKFKLGDKVRTKGVALEYPREGVIVAVEKDENEENLPYVFRTFQHTLEVQFKAIVPRDKHTLNIIKGYDNEKGIFVEFWMDEEDLELIQEVEK